MTHYFGFEPTEKLSGLIDEAYHIFESDSTEPYYPIRNEISQQIGRELIDNLLVNLISVIPDPERQARMTSIVSKIESATETMLNILLGKDKNEEVMVNMRYLEEETVFIDNSGTRRVGFKLDDNQAKTILDGFNSVTEESADKEKLKAALTTMNHAIVDHFIVRFSETLPLGMIKRKSVPVAKAAINKALDMAINKLFPELPLESLNRLVNFFKPFIVEKN